MGANVFVFLIVTVVSISCNGNIENVIKIDDDSATETIINEVNSTMLRKLITPGMVVPRYAIELDLNVDGGTFNGKVTAEVVIIDASAKEDPIIFYVSHLDIISVVFAIAGEIVLSEAEISVDEEAGFLLIRTGLEATMYSIIIEYSGSLAMVGCGLYAGYYDNE